MLKGANVQLAAPEPADSAVLFGWINDAETVRFNAPYRPVSAGAHDAWFAGLNRDPSRVFFAIRADSHLIGSAQLVDIHPVHRSAELMIRIGDDGMRGRGLGTEALGLLLRFAVTDLNLNRIWLRVFADNGRALRAYEKAGFEREGVMRRAAWINGQWVDEIIMAVLS